MKKGFVSISMIALIILAALFFVGLSYGLFYQGDKGGMFGKVKVGVKGAVDKLVPNITKGAPALKSGDLKIVEPGAETAIKKLKSTINQMINSKKSAPCFLKYGGLPALSETGVYFNYDSSKQNTQMIITTRGGDATKEKIDFNMIPCVIAGESQGKDISDNFYYTFLEKDTSKVKGSYFMPVQKISMVGGRISSTSGRKYLAKKQIDFGTGAKPRDNDGWLFTPDKKHICFFPTTLISNDKDGLNNDYVSETGENSINANVGNRFC